MFFSSTPPSQQARPFVLLPVALSSLLATLGGGAGVLSLLSLLLALGSGLLLLGILDGLLAGGGTGLGALVAALLDHVKVGTDDTTLRLHDTASTLLGDFLFTLKNFTRQHMSLSQQHVA